MGASNFYTISEGKTAKEAYSSAVEEAEYENGHDSYNGTISTTNGFKVTPRRDGESINEWEERMLDNLGKRECACHRLDDGRWLFVGWAAE